MLSLTAHTGNIFDAPDNAILVHACNTQGKWGAGIAAAFKTNYPNAFKVYAAHCLAYPRAVQTGTCLLIAPCESSSSTAPKHWIACLFTSAKFGFAKSGPDEILRNTDSAVKDMLKKIKEAEDKMETVGELRMCKINSGKFGVPWKRTEMLLGSMEVNEGLRNAVEIWDR